MRYYDISLPISGDTYVWPGDTPVHIQRNWEIEKGAAVNLGSLKMSHHAGTHTDAPFHTQNDGSDIASLDLTPYMGSARVIEIVGKPCIQKEDFAGIDFEVAPRVLLKTGGWMNRASFPERFPVMAPDVPDFLSAQGVVLIGLDSPSVDEFHSKDMPNHLALNRLNIRIVESLNLEGVPEGVYELIALPLKLCGADGSPVRAILRIA